MSELDESIFFKGSRGMQRVSNLDATDEEVTLSGGGLSEIATFLLGIRQVRIESLSSEKHQIDDVSFHIMLDLMASEDLGKLVTSQDLATTHDVKASTMDRYVDYLSSVGLIKKIDRPDSDQLTALKLTKMGLEICSDVLRKIDQRLFSL